MVCIVCSDVLLQNVVRQTDARRAYDDKESLKSLKILIVTFSILASSYKHAHCVFLSRWTGRLSASCLGRRRLRAFAFTHVYFLIRYDCEVLVRSRGRNLILSLSQKASAIIAQPIQLTIARFAFA